MPEQKGQTAPSGLEGSSDAVLDTIAGTEKELADKQKKIDRLLREEAMNKLAEKIPPAEA